ncbi:protein FAM47E [Parambassis ranga]|uniref:Protein FAM47E n=1 Tax=Parambassis ranga TaxID=210632 RepID=A0A6P7J1M6_9TELE|nr:putative protein FAM47C [Parambassis ranga]
METKNTTFPWYKERLQTQYLKASKNKLSSVSSCWPFLSPEDFSDCSSVSHRDQKDVSQLIFQQTLHHISSQKPRTSITKEHTCFSKQTTQKQRRREYVASVEEKLKQHPLAMYPHYKDHLTPELFDQVVSILDPGMCTNSPSASPALEEEDGDQAKQETSANNINPDVQKLIPRNPYVLEQIPVNNMKKHQMTSVSQPDSPSDTTTADRLFRKWFTGRHYDTA